MAPAVEPTHGGRYGISVSPRHVPASVTELSRVGLLAELPGERLTSLADRMQRDEVEGGAVLMAEGERGERFFVLLSGMVGISQQALGPRRLLRPGDYFGEVGAAMDIPRTATVTAITPCVVASCDRATFDEYVLPLFREGQALESVADDSSEEDRSR
jgi:ATP-binding cassette, subfamily B, bacterial